MQLKYCLVVAVLVCIGQSTHALQAKNNAIILYPAFILGLYLPLIIIFVITVFACRRCKRKRQMAPQPPPLPPRPKTQEQPLERLKTPELIGEDYTVPSYWTNQNPRDIIFVDITCDAAETMKMLIYSLWKVNEVGVGRDAKDVGDNVYINIHTVKRVQNIALYQNYLESKSLMERKENYIEYFKELGDLRCEPVLTTTRISTTPRLAGSDLEKDIDHGLNEHYLFHGTKNEYVQDICRKGLSTKVGRPGLYGSGVYTAEHPNKSDQYTDHNINENNTLLLCRVCLGEIFVQRNTADAKKLKSPPCRNCHQHGCRNKKHGGLTFDSVVADVNGLRFREFVVYRDYRVYPEYIIEYTRCSDGADIRSYQEN